MWGEHHNPWAVYEDEFDELSNSSSKEQEDVGGGGNLTEVDFGGNLSEDDLGDINHPLCVVTDYGGHGTSYLVVLPRRNWSRYFGKKISSD